MKNTAYLISAAGTNFGDDLITLLWIKQLRDANPQGRIIVDCVDPTTFALLLAKIDLAENVCVINLFWRTCGHYSAELNDAVPALERDLLYNESTDFRTAEKFFDTVAYIHLLGGGYVNDNWPKNALLAVITSFLKKRYHIPLFWTGTSVVPAAFSEKLKIAKYLSAFDMITTRDEKSNEVLSRWNPRCKFTCDDAFLFLHGLKTKKSKQKILFINIQKDLRDAAFYRKNIADVRAALKSWEGEVVYIDAFPLYDAEAFLYLKDLAPTATFISEHRFHELLFSGEFDIGTNSRAIVSRFHLHLLFSLLGVTGEYITPDDAYYLNKHKSLVTQGSGWKRFACGESAQPTIPKIAFAARAAAKQTETLPILGAWKKAIAGNKELSIAEADKTDALDFSPEKNAIEELHKTNTELNAALNAAVAERDLLREKLAVAEKTAADLAENLHSSEEKLKNAEKSISDFSEKNAGLVKENEEGKSKLSAQTRELTGVIEELRNEKVGFVETIKSLVAQDETQRKAQVALQNKFAETETALAAAQAETTALLKTEAETKSELAATQEILRERDKTLAKNKTTIDDLKFSVQTLKSKNDFLSAAFAVTEKERNLFLLRLSEMEARITNYHKMTKDPLITIYRKLRRTLGTWHYGHTKTN
jgi:polysaccharide pyruvyl transferase WcaK-like protein/peptidoglycan hydrolase CwlO-like protein